MVIFILNIDPVLGTIALPVEEGRQHLWYKVRAAFAHIHEHYLNEADFFYKADDDTFVVPQNLRKIVRAHSANDPIWMGCRFRMPSQTNEVRFKYTARINLDSNDIIGYS